MKRMEAEVEEFENTHKEHITILENLQGELRHSVWTLERELKNYSDFIVHCLDALRCNQLPEPEGWHVLQHIVSYHVSQVHLGYSLFTKFLLLLCCYYWNISSVALVSAPQPRPRWRQA